VEIVHGVANVVLVYFLCIFSRGIGLWELCSSLFCHVFLYNKFDIMNIKRKKFICNVRSNFSINEKC